MTASRRLATSCSCHCFPFRLVHGLLPLCLWLGVVTHVPQVVWGLLVMLGWDAALYPSALLLLHLLPAAPDVRSDVFDSGVMQWSRGYW